MICKCANFFKGIYMKSYTCILIIFFIGLSLKAEDGHRLWLRAKSTGPVNIVCQKNSNTLDIAKYELVGRGSPVEQ